MKKITITGGSGFIGTNLVESFSKEGYTIQNIDKATPVKESLNKNWECIDILDYKSLENSIFKFQPDIIIHMAAITDLNGVSLSYYNANIEGTQNIIKVAKKIKSLQKVIFTSSMYVCKPGYIPLDFDDYKPHTLYGESKVQGELMVKAISDVNYNWTIIRPTSIWGPWFKIPYIDFFKIVYQGKYFDFGKACTKTYGYVENTVYQIKELITSDKSNNKIFYLGDQPAIQISEWANEISMEMGKGKIRSIPYILLKSVALVGDILTKFKINFPITTFRLNNMTTNNVLPLDNLYNIAVKPPFSRIDGVRNTIAWLRLYRGYNLKK